MNKPTVTGTCSGVSRVPMRDSVPRALTVTPKGQTVLSQLFLKKYLTVQGKRWVPVDWLKVVAEWFMGRELYGPEEYVWVDQRVLERELRAQGFEFRIDARRPYVKCTLNTNDIKQWSFFLNGGRLK